MIQLLPDEKILLITRRHWFFIFNKIFYLFLFFLAPFIFKIAFNYFIFYSEINLLDNYLMNPTINIFLAIYALFLWAGFFVVLANYYLDVWIITDKRIIDFEHKGLFNHEIAECHISNIQDVAMEVSGIIPTFLKFGTVRVQTAGEVREITFKNVPNPYKIKDLILEYSQKSENKYEIK